MRTTRRALALAIAVLTAPLHARGAPGKGEAAVGTSGSSSRASGRMSGKWLDRGEPNAPAPMGNTVELGIYGGVLLPSKNHELYEEATVVQHRFKPAAFITGLRIGYMPLRFLGVEMEQGFAPSKSETGEDAPIFHMRWHLLAQLPYRFAPFVLAGGGLLGVVSRDRLLGTDVDGAFHWGLGVKAYALPWLNVRLDARHLVGPRVGDGGAASHFEILVGLGFVIGRCLGLPGRKHTSATASAGHCRGKRS